MISKSPLDSNELEHGYQWFIFYGRNVWCFNSKGHHMILINIVTICHILPNVSTRVRK